MNDNIQVKLGRKVREIRKGQGLSQEKFALKIEMDRTYLASLEAGKRNVALVNLQKIAKGFGLTLSELFQNL